jgi:hypothetical protein
LSCEPLLGTPRRPTVEGTPGAVEPVFFRERAGETALHGKPRGSVGSQVGGFERGRIPHGRQTWTFPSFVWHLLATGGVRVDLVGVNPSDERSSDGGQQTR